jgi:hypothetical protein
MSLAGELPLKHCQWQFNGSQWNLLPLKLAYRVNPHGSGGFPLRPGQLQASGSSPTALGQYSGHRRGRQRRGGD